MQQILTTFKLDETFLLFYYSLKGAKCTMLNAYATKTNAWASDRQKTRGDWQYLKNELKNK